MQIDFVPGAVIQGPGLWTPAEPLAWGQASFDETLSLARLADGFPSFKLVRKQVESSLISFQNRRLEQILAFLEKNSVDLCVFPEYAFIADPSTLQILAGFAPKITIVAGLGVPRSKGVEALKKYSADEVSQGSNVAAVFSGTECHLIAKHHPADGEEMERGSGIQVVKVHAGGVDFNLGVAICKDYLVAGHSLGGMEPVPDLVAIPAYSKNVTIFTPEAPRDFPRIFANHASYGGSTIYAAGCRGRFVDRGTPRPIPAGAEGIISVKWFGAPEKPVPLLKGENVVALRSAMVSGSDGKSAIDVVRAFEELSQSNTSSADLLDEQLPRWLGYARGWPRLALVSDALELYRRAAADDVLTMDTAEQLTRHLIAHETQSTDAHRKDSLSAVIKQVRFSMGSSSGDIDAYKTLVNALEKYGLARGDDSSQTESNTSDAVGDEVRHYFSIGLGKFTDKLALATLSDQQDLLVMFARSAPRGARVVYRLNTVLDPASGNVLPRFFVDFFGPAGKESEAYFTSLQRIARSVLRRGWQTYGATHQVASGYSREIVPKPGVPPKVRGDLGFLVDVLRATDGDCTLEISGIRIEEEAGEGYDDQSVSKSSYSPGDGLGVAGLFVGPQSGAGDTNSALDREATGWFMAQQPGSAKLGIRVILTTPERNDALCSLVGTALFGSSDWASMEVNGADSDAARAVVYPVEVAHRILHPPHGLIEGRGLSSQQTLFRPVTELTVIGEGAVLGKATVARPYVDEQMDVRIPDASRLLHTYVIGRTGVGKTNTLKNIVRHDLGGSGPVIVVDPHGDLYDYAIRHSTHRDTLVALDFTSDQVPSLNPLYLDAKDAADVFANIEQYIELTLNSLYFEWAGPRFSDLLRLCLETLVTLADEVVGDWAYIGDVLRLIEDQPYRDAMVSKLKGRGATDLVRRWHLHNRVRDGERAEVEQWFISKFGEFRRPGGLARATLGKPSVNLMNAVRNNAAVLVKVPATTLGQTASRFLGSLVVERILRYAMSGAFIGMETPARLIVDEFQTFVGTSFATLIAEARKFNLGITVANQTLSQLSDFSPHEGRRNDDISQVILGNVGNMIIQGVGRRDAERLATEVGVTADELSRIGKHRALVQLTVNGERLEPFTVDLSASSERPGTVAEAVAQTQATEHLQRLSEEVVIPAIDRSSEPEQPQSPRQEPGDESKSSIDDWFERSWDEPPAETDDKSMPSGEDALTSPPFLVDDPVLDTSEETLDNQQGETSEGPDDERFGSE
ncbi:DUF87 domain-containing protein [Streptomyces sp. W16]|uniref:helicase HerA domain-containing protein n=1 Tax=Streptomyces sp. W16 TaxID=3076631 RepID=UPI00295BF262|nr:DUF87 domain-containing protein [Streptomyces sp. W16]MDV9171523.1 DUF87 domain-containing protein [Streptomyces sp. W16]